MNVSQLIKALQLFDGNKFVGFSVRESKESPSRMIELLGVCLKNEYGLNTFQESVLTAQHVELEMIEWPPPDVKKELGSQKRSERTKC